MTFKEWFNSAPHRAKYSNDHPAYLAAQEAWEAAHEACAEFIEHEYVRQFERPWRVDLSAAIRARGQA